MGTENPPFIITEVNPFFPIAEQCPDLAAAGFLVAETYLFFPLWAMPRFGLWIENCFWG